MPVTLRSTCRGVITPLIAVLALAGSACAYAQAPNPTTSAQAIAWLNAQREDNGIPGGIVDNPSWDVACRDHVNWLVHNPNSANPHIESPGTTGYTPEGAWAGAHSVLLGTFVETNSLSADEEVENTVYPWGAINTWEWAPTHLMQLLAPELQESGFSPGCMVTLGRQPRPAPSTPRLLTYPAAGTSFIYPVEDAFEWPFTPEDFVGLVKHGLEPPPATGPNLLVFAWGAGPGRITSASLRGPQGQVPVSTVDDETTGPLGDIGAYMPPGGVIIPRETLKPFTVYTASVSFAPPPLSTTWTFSTGPLPNMVVSSGTLEHIPHHFSVVNVYEGSTAPNLTFRLVGPRGRVLHARRNPHGNWWIATVKAPGRWTVCILSGGPPTLYAPVRKCSTLQVPAKNAGRVEERFGGAVEK
jgi:hypothetical protein